MKAKLLLCWLLFFTNAFSQGEFLSNDESGFAFGLGISRTPSSSGRSAMETTTIGAGYSLWGRLDFGFTFGFLNTTSFSDAKSASLSLAWYFAKQENAKRGVSAAIALSYQHLTYGRHTLEKAYPFQPTTVTEAENSTILGLVLFRDVSFDEVYLVQPILSAQLVSAKRNTFVAGSIGISIGGKNQLARAFAITPTIGFQEGVVFYGVAVSVVISTSRKE